MNYLMSQGLWVVTLHAVTVEWCIWAMGSIRLALEVLHATIQDKALIL